MMKPARGRDVAIVGAGPGGLAATVLLSASGVRVTVYEAGQAIGGRTGQVEADGFRFDRGPTFFMMPYVLDEVFAAAGKRLHDMVELTRLDPMYRLVIGQREGGSLLLDATQDVDAMCARIGAINEHDGRAFRTFLDDNRYKLRHSESILRNPMRTPLDLFTRETLIDTIKVGPVLRPHQSVHQLLSSYFEDPRVRLAVSFQSKYLGMSPFECPSLFTILPFIEYEYGIWHPKGGCHALMRALAELARELGATIHTGARVEQVVCAGTRATGVAIGGDGPLSGRTISHDHVVLNADATWAMKHLLSRQSRKLAGGSAYDDDVVDRKKYSCSTAMLYLGVDGEVDLPHHTIYISASYRENLEDITRNGALTQDASVYVCNPSRIDATLAPKGKSALYVLVPTPNCDAKIDWEGQWPALRERALEQVRTKMGVDLRGRIITETPCSPVHWREQNINKGATFNLAHNLGQMLHKRPQNRLKGFENVYLVGGGTHPGSGLPTIFLSAQISSRMICDAVGATFAGAHPTVREVARKREMRGGVGEVVGGILAR